MLGDAWGLAVSISSRAAVDAYDRGGRALFGFGDETVEHDRGADALPPQIHPLLATVLRAGEPERARALLAWRLTRRPRPGHCWQEPGRVATAASQRREAPA